jgi:damage-control phosphatase, subfamily I
MKARPDCIPCLFTQALNTVRQITQDPDVHMRVLREVSAYAAALSRLEKSPAETSKPIYEIISRLTGVADPFERAKDESNRGALELLPHVAAIVNAAPDPLDMALHAAAAGNIIDFGINHVFDIQRDILPVLSQPFAVNAVEEFRVELKPGRRVLYLADNSGEIVFDRLLVEQIQRAGASVTVAVKSGPIINDATIKDARQAGLTDIVRVIETGTNDIGTILANTSAAFRREFEAADAIVAKGHGNFETCNDTPGNFYFLLKIKCKMVAEELGIEAGRIVFKHQSRSLTPSKV